MVVGCYESSHERCCDDVEKGRVVVISLAIIRGGNASPRTALPPNKIVNEVWYSAQECTYGYVELRRT